LYASNTGEVGSWTTLLSITGASYTSDIYSNTDLSTHTTPYLYYCIAVNAILGYIDAVRLNIMELIINGKQIIITSATSG
jgi:hypothetical protein